MKISPRSRAVHGAFLMALLLSLLHSTVTPSHATAETTPSDTPTPEQFSPLTVEVSIAKLPAIDESSAMTVTVASAEPATGVNVQVVVSGGVRIDGDSDFVVDLGAGESRELHTTVTATAAGNQSVGANARYDLGGGNVWGDSDAVFFSTGDDAALSGFTYSGDPYGGRAAPGPGNTTDLASVEFADASPSALAHDAATPLPVAAGEPGAVAVEPESDPSALSGLFRIQGKLGMNDRRGVWRTQMLLVQLRSESGASLGYTYSNTDGNFVFNVPNPGRFTIRVWANYRHESMVFGAIRVVGSGFQTPDPFTVGGWYYDLPLFGPINGHDGVDVGSWRPADDWEGRRAWWIYQDMIAAFAYTWNRVPPGTEPGTRQPDGVTVEWQPGSTDGAYYHVAQRRVHLADWDANSAHTVLHEFGHAAMQNAYGGYFPPNDCPSPHYISMISGPTCAWTEGWALFFAMSVTADPVYKWGCILPCDPTSMNLEETHTLPYEQWQDGDQVEGNIAAALWDFTDPWIDGLDKTTSLHSPFADIWNVVWNFDFSRFSYVWETWSTNGMNSTNTLATLYHNTIDYGWQNCPDHATEPNDDPLRIYTSVNPADGPTSHALCTDGDVDFFRISVKKGGTYTIETKNLGTTPGGTFTNTTLVLYSMNQFGGLNLLATDDNSGSENLASKIVYTAPNDGVWYAGVQNWHDRGNFGFTYDIDFTASVPNVAPTVSGPTQRLIAGQTLGKSSSNAYTLKVRTKWTASDPDDGIASQTLRHRINSSGFVTVTPGPSATARTYDVPVTIGTNNQFQVRATDKSGAPSDDATGESVHVAGKQETSFTYSGSWTSHSSSNAWGGTYRRTSGGMAVKATYHFTGKSAAIVGMKRSDGGRAAVYVDGVRKGTIDFYSATGKVRQVLFAVNGLSNDDHTIEILWISSKNPSSSNYRLFLDGGISLGYSVGAVSSTQHLS